jgi:hypothetical protein
MPIGRFTASTDPCTLRCSFDEHSRCALLMNATLTLNTWRALSVQCLATVPHAPQNTVSTAELARFWRYADAAAEHCPAV